MKTLKLSRRMSGARIAASWQTQDQWTAHVHNLSRQDRTERARNNPAALFAIPDAEDRFFWGSAR